MVSRSEDLYRILAGEIRLFGFYYETKQALKWNDLIGPAFWVNHSGFWRVESGWRKDLKQEDKLGGCIRATLRALSVSGGWR